MSYEPTLEEVNQTLVAARLLLSDPDNWVKGSFAKDVSRHSVAGYSPSAVCFCSQGALTAVTGELTKHKTAALDALNCVVPMLSRNNAHVVGFNDRRDTTHADILEMFDLAITLTEPLPCQ